MIGKLSEDRGTFAKNLRRTPRERGSKEVAGTPADKEEFRQRLENSREDWGTPGKTGELQGRLQSSAEVWEAPATVDLQRGTSRRHCKEIAKEGQL